MKTAYQLRREQYRAETKADKKLLHNILLDAIDLSPDYSQSTLPALEVKQCKFKYNKPDLSRLIVNKTEDEIIDSVLFPEKNNHRKVSAIEYANAGTEVQQYWRDKIADSQQRRGRAYSKISEKPNNDNNNFGLSIDGRVYR